MSTVIEKVLRLQELEVFDKVYTQHLSQLASIAREIVIERDTVLFRENDFSATLHLLVSGTVDLSRKGRVTGTVRREILDPWSFLSKSRHLQTALARERCTILTVEYDEFVDLVTAEPELCWAITRSLAKMNRKLLGG
jgi:CRP-like cAMP-binding protein